MKSAIVWNEFEELKYAVVDGDWTEFQDIYINGVDDNQELQDKLSSKVYNQDGKTIIDFCTIYDFANAIRLGAVVVECGFIP